MSEPATDTEVEAVLECLRSGWLTMGPRIQEFEAAFADWLGTAHACAVSSGTAGLELARIALPDAQVAASPDAGPGDIEDARDALGERLADGRLAGSAGAAGVFSFADGRRLSTGQGGMVVTDDPEVDRVVRLLRAHGMTSGTWDRHRGHSATYDLIAIGFNYRLDEPRAALGLAKLAELREA